LSAIDFAYISANTDYLINETTINLMIKERSLGVI
jgi:hypothetical protein